MKKLIFLPIVAVIAIGFFIFTKSSPKPPKSLDSGGGSNLQMYYSCAFGYGVGTPKDWVVNDTNFASNQEIILLDQTKSAVIKINASVDKKIDSTEAVALAIGKIKEQMSTDPNLKLTSFRDQNIDQGAGYLAVGEQTIDGENYGFQSQGLIHTNGRILQFHGVIKSEMKANYPENLISEIVTSFVVDKDLACENSAS